MTSFPTPAWLVGCGNMAGAMVAGWRKAGIDLSPVTVIRPSGRAVEGVTVVTELPAGSPRFVLLGMKPQKLDEVAPALAERLTGETILVSMLAGTGVDSLARRFPTAIATESPRPSRPTPMPRSRRSSTN